MQSDRTALQEPSGRRRAMAMALAVAVVSDVLGVWAELVPPVQWALDLATAVALFFILGRRWAILPALIAEAIPGLGVLPLWIMVVGSMLLYDDIRAKER